MIAAGDEDSQSAKSVPAITPGSGLIFTVMLVELAHPLPSTGVVYVIIVVPRIKADTRPVLSIVATEVLLLLHAPFGVKLARAEVFPTQSDVCPVIPCTTGSAFIVIFCVFLLVHPFTTAVV